MFEHREKNPRDSFETIAKIFSEKFNVDERFDQENEDEDCVILELVQPEEIKVAVPTPSANQRMTKKKNSNASLTFSVNSNKK